MQRGFYFDQSRCSNCLSCVVACKDWHDLPAGSIFWRRVISVERGRYPDLSISFLSISCHHCGNPPCVPACPREIIKKRETDGIVVVNSQECLGLEDCGACREACPYGAVQFGTERDAKMNKCDLCLNRWAEGKRPICIESCPMRALDAGPMDELRSKYGAKTGADGFKDFGETHPSIVFKTKD
jgi:anaerobic dimethyl sulfoxide reductase subunit B (iron-sulfur subunit)